MKVIKSNSVHYTDVAPIVLGEDGHVTPQETVDHEQLLAEIEEQRRQSIEQADAVMQDAMRRAEALAQQAESEATRVHDEAYDAGYREGYEYAMSQVEEQKAQLLSEAAATLDDARRERREILAHAEGEILALTLAISRKVIGVALEQHTDAYLSLIRTAIAGVQHADGMGVKLSSAMYEKHINTDTLTLDTASGDVTLHVTPEHSLPEDALYIDTPSGGISAGAMTQLDNLESAMLGDAFDSSDFERQLDHE